MANLCIDGVLGLSMWILSGYIRGVQHGFVCQLGLTVTCIGLDWRFVFYRSPSFNTFPPL